MTNDTQRVSHPRVRRCHPLHPLVSSKKETGAPPGSLESRRPPDSCATLGQFYV
jgi:hypothetical protein